MNDPYDSADFYDTRNDLERYYTTDESEALGDALDSAITGDPVEWCLANSITIHAFIHPGWSAEDREQQSYRLLEVLNSDLYEFGDPDGDPLLGEDARLLLLEALTKMNPEVWSLEESAKRTYSGEALLAKVRELCPEMLEDGE